MAIVVYVSFHKTLNICHHWAVHSSSVTVTVLLFSLTFVLFSLPCVFFFFFARGWGGDQTGMVVCGGHAYPRSAGAASFRVLLAFGRRILDGCRLYNVSVRLRQGFAPGARLHDVSGLLCSVVEIVGVGAGERLFFPRAQLLIFRELLLHHFERFFLIGEFVLSGQYPVE